jgi:hypothetical protein
MESKFAGTGPSSYKKCIYQATVSLRSRTTELEGKNIVLNIFNILQNPLILNNYTTNTSESKLRTGIYGSYIMVS